MSDFYLKILTGNHIGACIPIASGDYIVGRNFECDIVLTDDSLNENEFKIEIKDDNSIFIESFSDKPVVINGNTADLKVKVHNYDVFISGGIFFVIGPASENWPDIEIPKLENLEISAKTTEQETIVNETTEEQESDTENTEVAEDEQQKLEQDSNTNKKKADNKPSKIKLMSFCFLIIFLIAILLRDEYFNLEKFIPNQQVGINILDKAGQIRNELGLKSIKFKKTSNNVILITGYCQSYTQERQLYHKLNKNGITFEAKIFIMNDIFEKAKLELELISTDDVQLEIDNTPGNLILKGYAKNTEDINNIISALKERVEGLIAIIDQVDTFDNRLALLKNLIFQHGFSANIKVIPNSKQEVILKGRLIEEKQIYKLKKLIVDFNKNYKNKPKIKLETIYAGNYINTNDDAQPDIKLNIKSINIGKIPHITLQDGSKYLIGSIIQGQYIIKDISINSLILIKDGKTIHYYIGGLDATKQK